MNPQRMLGAGLLALGVVLLIFGMNASDSFADQWSNFFTGRYTENTRWYILGGAASAAVGLVMVVFGGRKAAV
jgi:hypothetical protein